MSSLSDDEAAELKAALQRARRQPMNFAAALGKRPEDHRLSLHHTRAGRALAKVLKETTGSKQLAFGTTEVDDSRKDTLVLVLEAKPPTGLAKKLANWLKLHGQPIRKVALKLEGQELEDDGTDDGAPPPPVTTPAPSAPTPTTGPGSADGDTAALDHLRQSFDKLAPRIAAALGTPGDRAKLPKLREAFQQALQQGAATRARQALIDLAKLLQAIELPNVRQATSQLPKALGNAIAMTRHLQDDLEVQQERTKFKATGDKVRDLVLQARKAARQTNPDPKVLDKLQKAIKEQREVVQKQLKSLVPKKGQANAGPDGWAGLVARLDLASPKDGAVFWSGDKYNAIDISQSDACKGNGVSLESTAGGCLMDDWGLDGMPWDEKEGEGPPFKKDLWCLLSATYAMQAEGRITIVQTPEKHKEGGGEMWRLVERQVLLAKIAQGTVTMGPTIVREKSAKDKKG